MIGRGFAIAIAFIASPALAQHEGHAMGHGDNAHSAEAPDPHADHAMPLQSEPPVAPADSSARSGPDHAAATIFGADAMARARETLLIEHGNVSIGKVMIDRLETRVGAGEDHYAWDAQFRWGGDRNKVWFKSEGEAAFGKKVDVEGQALWSRAIDPWFDVQMGIRHDFKSGADRTHAVIGVQGLAPYWFEVDGALFLSDKGNVTARAEAEYDLRITPALILQPRAELEAAFQDISALGIGAGLSTAVMGARLRYEFVPRFAPYLGVEWQRSLGGTRRFAHAAGESSGGWSMLLGLRAWF